MVPLDLMRVQITKISVSFFYPLYFFFTRPDPSRNDVDSTSGFGPAVAQATPPSRWTAWIHVAGSPPSPARWCFRSRGGPGRGGLRDWAGRQGSALRARGRRRRGRREAQPGRAGTHPGTGEAVGSLDFLNPSRERHDLWQMAEDVQYGGMLYTVSRLIDRASLYRLISWKQQLSWPFAFWQFSGLKKSLPHNVHVLTLEPWKGKSLLLRLEHFVEKGEDHELSKVATVDVQVSIYEQKLLNNKKKNSKDKSSNLFWFLLPIFRTSWLLSRYFDCGKPR